MNNSKVLLKIQTETIILIFVRSVIRLLCVRSQIMKSWKKAPLTIVVALLIVGIIFSPVLGASTTKTLSTNFTLVNFGADVAHVTVQYLKSTGEVWNADSANTTFDIPASGGQKIIRQYSDTTMTSGQGSAVITSSQPLGAVVQLQARGQTPSSGAYSGYQKGSQKFYVPLVIRQGNSASGTTNSQIIIQNMGTNNTDVSVDFVPSGAFSSYQKLFSSLQPGVSISYDLDGETNLVAGWTGSAVVTATTQGGVIGVVSNFFTGPDAMQTFNAFPQESVATKWFVPLFLSRNSNGLSSPVAVQNLSGGSIGIGGLTMTCTPNAGSVNQTVLNLSNAAAIANNAAYYFNPVSDTVNIPAEWYGSCVITSGTAGVVSFVQLRYVGIPGNAGAAAYEAIPASTDTVAYFPLIVKRGANGFATAVTIQNIGTSNATVDLIYTPSPDYAGSQTPITIQGLPIAAGQSLVRNHRQTAGEPTVPDDWFGSLKVISTGAPVSGFVQLTYYTPTTGDTFMAHDAFTSTK